MLIRYPYDLGQDVRAASVTVGYFGTGATRLADFKDEVRPLGGAMGDAGVCLGYTFVARGETVEAGKVPHLALRFALKRL